MIARFNSMKKLRLISLLMAAMMLLSLMGCGNKTESEDSKDSPDATVEPSKTPDESNASQEEDEDALQLTVLDNNLQTVVLNHIQMEKKGLALQFDVTSKADSTFFTRPTSFRVNDTQITTIEASSGNPILSGQTLSVTHMIENETLRAIGIQDIKQVGVTWEGSKEEVVTKTQLQSNLEPDPTYLTPLYADASMESSIRLRGGWGILFQFKNLTDKPLVITIDKLHSQDTDTTYLSNLPFTLAPQDSLYAMIPNAAFMGLNATIQLHHQVTGDDASRVDSGDIAYQQPLTPAPTTPLS